MPESKTDALQQFIDVIVSMKWRDEVIFALFAAITTALRNGGGELTFRFPFGRRDLLEVGYANESYVRFHGAA